MTRGVCLKLTDEQRAQRLINLAVEQLHAKAPALYTLTSGQNGGSDPTAPHPFTLCPDGRLRADCIGAALWAQGIDRYQPERFPLYKGWINTDSALMDALGERAVTGVGSDKPHWALFRPAALPRPGIMVIYPSRFVNGRKLPGSWGHILGIVSVSPALIEWPGLEAAADRLEVVHCHGGFDGRTVRAVERETLASAIGGSVRKAHLIELTL